MLGVFSKFALHSRVAIDLELMELYKVQAEGVYPLHASDDIVVALVWKTEDKVRTNIESVGLALGHRIYGALEVVTTVYVGKSGVVDRLDTILNSDIFVVG